VKRFGVLHQEWGMVINMMIQVYDLRQKKMIDEDTPNYVSLLFLYHSFYGRGVLHLLVKRKIVSELIGKMMKSRGSIKRIKPFIKKYRINQDEFNDNIDDYKCFNDFFIRKLRHGAREFDFTPDALCSPCDGKVLAWENIEPDFLCQFKGMEYSLAKLFDNEALANEYKGGTCIVFRLSPTDYHRFHFMDNGICGVSRIINGKHYYSVNPLALEKMKEVYLKNKRSLSIFESDNFGKVLIVEVGATAVGSIKQTYTAGERVERGSEKGYFEFGGSTVILFFMEGKADIDNDIILNTQKGIECKVLAGEKIGHASKK